MPRFLVVANQPLGGDHLLELLRDRAAEGELPAGASRWLRLDLLSRARLRAGSLVAGRVVAGEGRP